jgi:PadR family transcriptional regulator, regulatory protein AphA
MSPMIKAPLTMEHALLGFLLDDPIHAYEMHQQLHQAEALGLVWRIKQSQLYALLSRLEEVGYLTMVTAPQETRPARKMLHLTPAGRAAFEMWRVTPVHHGRELRQEFLAKLYFAQLAGPSFVKQLIEAQRTVSHTMMAALQARADAAKQPYARLVYEFRHSQVKASFEWLDRCEAILFPTDDNAANHTVNPTANTPPSLTPSQKDERGTR